MSLFFLPCTLSAKDWGATKNPGVNLELILMHHFPRILQLNLSSVLSMALNSLVLLLHASQQSLKIWLTTVLKSVIYAPRSLPTVCISHYQKLCNPVLTYLECSSIIWELFARKSADIHESSQLIHYYLYTISILCSPFYLLRALYPNRTSVESRLDSAHKPWYTVLCSGAKFISSHSDFSKKGTITDGDLKSVSKKRTHFV